MNIVTIRRLSATVGVLALFNSGCLLIPPAPQPGIGREILKEKPAVKWRDTRSYEEKQKLKPEPYSLDSNQSDPELLGPQSTLENNPLARKDEEVEEIAPGDERSLYTHESDSAKKEDTQKKQETKSTMSKNRCIGLIGLSKFNEYSRKYGGERAAIQRCIILSGRR